MAPAISILAAGRYHSLPGSAFGVKAGLTCRSILAARCPPGRAFIGFRAAFRHHHQDGHFWLDQRGDYRHWPRGFGSSRRLRADLVRHLALPDGRATMIYGEIMALCQTDLKRMLAYSTTGPDWRNRPGSGLGTWLATAGALWHVFNHATMKRYLLFLCGGRADYAGRLARVRRSARAGLAMQMPITVACMCLRPDQHHGPAALRRLLSKVFDDSGRGKRGPHLGCRTAYGRRWLARFTIRARPWFSSSGQPILPALWKTLPSA